MEYLERKYKCVKCGRPTINNQTIGSHCHICWDELIVTIILMPIHNNLKKWLEK